MDFNIVAQRNSETVCDLTRTLQLAVEWGYTKVAINTIIGTNSFVKEGVQIPKSAAQIELENITPSCQVLSRLTAVVTDERQCHQLTQSSLVKRFDILALEPMNEKVFAHICANMEFEIMCLDLRDLHFPLKKEQLKHAKKRGIHFEIQYSQLFDDDRTWTIANGRSIVSAGCKKNIIVGSGATKPLQIRKPNSVVNLCTLLGLSREESKDAVFRNGQLVIQQARMRAKTGKAVFSVQDTDKLSQKETWLIEACNFNALRGTRDSTNIGETWMEEVSLDNNYETPSKRAKADEVDDNVKD